MQSFLVVAKEKDKASSYVSNFLKEKGIDPIDISLHSFEKAIGIEDVRNIQKKILLKPFRGKAKAIVIETYENITTEAQNALLKVLEEPPANTIIIISASRKELLLPTILSRCKIIELKESNLVLSSEENAQYFNILISLSKKGIGYKLKLAQDIARNKDESILWLEKMILTARQELTSLPQEKLNDSNHFTDTFNALVAFQKTFAIIKSTNVNQRIALENLFLSF